MSRIRILFVDDEPRVLEGLKRTLHSQRDHWMLSFALGGEQGLKTLDENPMDVVVSDMRMPGMDGAQFLTQVRDRFPNIIRLVLSGFADQALTARAVNVAHQYLAKPCDPQELRRIVDRAMQLRNELRSHAIRELIARMGQLPSAPSVYQEMLDAVADPGEAFDGVAHVIRKDPAMTAKILHLVNSSFFGLRRRVTDPAQAIVLLGWELTRTLILSIHIFEGFRSRTPMVEKLWEHSTYTAAGVRLILNELHAGADDVACGMTAGMLHDIGRLLLAASLPDEYRTLQDMAQRDRVPLHQVEQQVLGVHHATVGAYLLGLWGLPDGIVEVVAFHHHPDRCAGRDALPLMATHVTAALMETLAADADHPASDDRPRQDFARNPLLELPYLEELGYAAQLPHWYELLHHLRQRKAGDVAKEGAAA
jgi:HD-like signal output (HDOD) protein/CheY-like chemotaxis protein